MAGRTGYTSVDGDQPHAHSYAIDEYGNGQTDKLLGEGPPHTHMITNMKVSPSGFDSHVHKLMAGQFGSKQEV